MIQNTLIRLAQIEGQAENYEDLVRRLLEEDLLSDAIHLGYFDGMTLVVGGYKRAAVEREVNADGVNTYEPSVDLFRSVGQSLSVLAMDETRPVVTRALLIHDDASCQAPHNGNKGWRQNAKNKDAHKLLLVVSPDDRDEDWQFVHAKCAVGLYESGAVDFDEGAFKDIIDFKARHKAKDFAGRVKFYAGWLYSNGRTDEAIALLENSLQDDDFSAPNQLKEAQELFQKLRA